MANRQQALPDYVTGVPTVTPRRLGSPRVPIMPMLLEVDSQQHSDSWITAKYQCPIPFPIPFPIRRSLGRPLR